jgi:hypothetical protein
MPRVEMFHLTTPSSINPLGVKGAGEAGTIPVTAAVAGAVEDALRPFGVRVTRMPLNPARTVRVTARGGGGCGDYVEHAHSTGVTRRCTRSGPATPAAPVGGNLWRRWRL